jgi:hypothetical protein
MALVRGINASVMIRYAYTGKDTLNKHDGLLKYAGEQDHQHTKAGHFYPT